MKKNSTLVYFLAVFVFIITAAKSTYGNGIIQQQYQFKSLNIDEGLSQGRVHTVAQDRFGYIWLGTNKGINRYDGYTIQQFSTFVYKNQELDITMVKEIIVDGNNKLWAAASEGLLYFDNSSERFVRYIDSEGILEKHGLVISVKPDVNNTLWVSTNDVLLKLNTSNGNIEEIPLNDINGNVLTGLVECFVQSNGNVWVGFNEHGCGSLDIKTGGFKHFKSEPNNPNTLGDEYIHIFYEDGSGNIWIGQDENGFSIYNPNTKKINTYLPDSINPTSGRVKGFTKDSNGNTWVGTMAGLYRVDTLEWKFFRYAHSGHLFSTLSHSSIQCLFIDKQETLWIGTYAGGVNYTNLVRNGFYHYKHSLIPNKYFLSQKDVLCMNIDHSGNLWVGTESGGLDCFDLSTGEFVYYKEDIGNPDALQSNNIKKVLVTPENNLWVATYNGGISYFNSDTKTFKTYKTNSTEIKGLASNRVFSVFKDRNGNLWAGTSVCLNMLPKGSDKFISINGKTSGYQGAEEFPFVASIIQDSRGWLWFAGHSNVVIFKPEEYTFYDLTKMDLFDNQRYESLVEDSNGDVWFDGGFGKIVRYVSEDNSFRVFGAEDNIPQVYFSSLVFDSSGDLWASSQEGLFRFRDMLNSQDSITYTSYGKDDGLQSKFFYTSFLEEESGVMYVGGINGFNSFTPDQVISNPYYPDIVLTKLKVNNKYLQIGEEVGRRKVLKKSLLETQRLVFHSKVKVFSIEFAGLHFISPPQNTYQYTLEGYDDHWIETSADKRVASYSNLPAGRYTFKVKAANSDEIWNEVPAELEIRVRPPFYKTKLFIVIMIIVVILGGYYAMIRREQQLKDDKQKLEQSLAEGLAQVEAQKNEIKNQQEEIKKRDEEEKEIRWSNRGLAKFSEIISKNKENYTKLSQAVISELVNYIEAQQGAIYLLNDNDPENPQLDFSAGYAYSNVEGKKSFRPGVSYVGTCFVNKSVIRLDELPEDYLKIQSGLGEVQPNFVVLVPMMFDELVTGVIEIGSFKRIEDYKIDLIQKVAESATSIIAIIKSEQKSKEAVDIAYQNAEEMQAADEELRQNLEEMTTIQEELNRNQDKLLTEQAMFQTLMDFLEDRVTFKDSESIYLRINKIKAKALKISDPNDAIGKSDLHFFGEEHFKKAYKSEKDIFNKGVPVLHKEELIRFDDGAVKWGETSRVPFKSEDGKAAGTLIITRDISEIKQLKSETKAYHELLQTLSQEYPVLIYTLDNNFVINDIFGSGMQKYELDKKKYVGNSFFKAFRTTSDQLEKKKDKQAIQSELRSGNKILTLDHSIVYNESNEGYTCCAIVV